MPLKKFFTVKSIAIAIVLLLLVLLSAAWFFRVSILERHLSKELNLNVHVKNITLGFGKLIIDNMTIKNPRSTAIPNVLEIQRMAIDISPFEFFKSKKTIDRLEVFTPTIYIEFYSFDGGDSDWSNILNSFTYNSSNRYRIKELSLLEIYFNAYNFEGASIPIWPIPYIEIKGLDGEKGLPLSALVHVIMTEVFSNMTSSESLEPFIASIKQLPLDIYTPEPIHKRY